jgi:hypothetical protein
VAGGHARVMELGGNIPLLEDDEASQTAEEVEDMKA